MLLSTLLKALHPLARSPIGRKPALSPKSHRSRRKSQAQYLAYQRHVASTPLLDPRSWSQPHTNLYEVPCHVLGGSDHPHVLFIFFQGLLLEYLWWVQRQTPIALPRCREFPLLQHPSWTVGLTQAVYPRVPTTHLSAPKIIQNGGCFLFSNRAEPVNGFAILKLEWIALWLLCTETSTHQHIPPKWGRYFGFK